MAPRSRSVGRGGFGSDATEVSSPAATRPNTSTSASTRRCCQSVIDATLCATKSAFSLWRGSCGREAGCFTYRASSVQPANADDHVRPLEERLPADRGGASGTTRSRASEERAAYPARGAQPETVARTAEMYRQYAL